MAGTRTSTCETDGSSPQAIQYMDLAHASATMRAYQSGFRQFKKWCELNGHEFLPPTEQTVGNYLAIHADQYSLATLNLRISAIQYHCHEAGAGLNLWHPSIRRVLRGIQMSKKEPQKHAAAFTPEDINALVSAAGGDLGGKRDRALILVGFAGAFRRSELVGIDVEHAKEAPDGMVVFVPRSKTDQGGHGAVVEIGYGSNPETCPVLALRGWLAAWGSRSVRCSGRWISGATCARTDFPTMACGRSSCVSAKRPTSSCQRVITCQRTGCGPAS